LKVDLRIVSTERPSERIWDSSERRRIHGRRLTDRQTAILELVASGLENKEIAFRLGVSEQAIKEHVSTLLRLLSAPNRAALADAAATKRFVGTLSIDPDWLRFLFQEAPMQIAIVSGPEHAFVAVNDAYRQATGARDLVGLRYAEAFPDRSESLALLDEAFRTGRQLVRTELPRRFVRGAGAEEAGYITAMLQPLPGTGASPAGIAIFSVDVTDSVRARERLRELEAEQLAVLDQLPLGVVVINREGRIARVNQVAAGLIGRPATGVPPSQLLGLLDAATGEEVPATARPLARALMGERVLEAEYLAIVRTTGEKIVLRVSASPLFDEAGTVRGAVGVFSRLARWSGVRSSERCS